MNAFDQGEAVVLQVAAHNGSREEVERNFQADHEETEVFVGFRNRRTPDSNEVVPLDGCQSSKIFTETTSSLQPFATLVIGKKFPTNLQSSSKC